MAFSRNSLVATVAGSLSLAVLTGCPTAPTQTATPTPGASTTTGATPTPVASTGTGTATPTPGTSTQPSGTTSASPTTQTSAPPASGKVTIVSGNVYDEASATVDGAVVKVTSLDASVPYTASTTTSAGSYVVNNVPEGANVEIVVSKDGWTSRRRVGSFQTNANQKNEVNFGGTGTLANGGTDPGQAYFISKYPEITAVEPAYDASNVDWKAVSYKLTLSESLDDVNRRRFEDAIRLIPANSYAAPENDSPTTTIGDMANAKPYTVGSDLYYFNLKDQKIKAGSAIADNINANRPVDPNPTTYFNLANTKNHPTAALNSGAANTLDVPWDYSIKKGTLFLDDSTTRATVTWNADNTQATLTFAAPLIADRTNNAKYQVALVTTSTSDKIVDKDNNQLGMDATGSMQSYPSAIGLLLHGTIRQPDLALVSTDNTAALRWVRTHQDAALFSTMVDPDSPKLVSVAYTKNLGQSSRFEFTFDEPLASYNGRSGGHVDPAIRNATFLNNSSIAISDRAGGTKNVSLKGTTTNAISNVNANGTFSTTATNSADVEKEIRLVPTNGLQGGTSLVTYASKTISQEEAAPTLAAGELLVTVDPRNPKTLFVYIVNRTNIFASNIVELKARVEGVADPAGNAIKSADADTQQIQGSI
jgi:hypothetical protein